MPFFQAKMNEILDFEILPDKKSSNFSKQTRPKKKKGE